MAPVYDRRSESAKGNATLIERRYRRKANERDLLKLFRQTGALLDGHFVLRSGLHSRQFFQCTILLQHTDIAARVCGILADRLPEIPCDTIISPALGGIIAGQEVGRSLDKRHIFVEKEGGGLVLRRGFTISSNEKFIVAEDVVTRGGRVQQTIEIVQQHGGIVTGSVLSSIAAARTNRISAVHSSV